MSGNTPHPPPGIDVSQAVEDLLDVRVVASAFRMYRDYASCKPPYRVRLRESCRHYSAKIDEGVLVLGPRFRLTASGELVDDANIHKPIFGIRATIFLSYRVSNLGAFSKESLDAFADTNGRFNAWPYWREFVQSTCARAHLPQLVIPVFQPMKRGTRSLAESSEDEHD